MSHTITANNNNGPVQLLQITILNYALGGEQVLISELMAVASIDAVFFATVTPGQNSLGVPLFPILEAGKVKLYRFVAGVPTEIPATTALNAVVSALLHVNFSA